MPLGIERINARTAQPNPNINFIKVQEGPDKACAQDFLERVAAICVPIMKRNHIYVMSLEDFPTNDEFLGRNFNAGEKIQLVLKNKRGGWLPFRFVQRVMMHELAHCKQMNHSKYFWQVHNQHCAELKTLWEQGYTGDGMWSRGVLLSSGDYVLDRPLAEGDIPEHLCGGAFRSNKKRKRGAVEKEKISYQERQQRRIAKKFGTNGVALGADDKVKTQLERGKRNTAKPRVAGSARGRELRAAAALARFDKLPTPVASNETIGQSSGSESDDDDVKIKPDDAKDINGHRLVDSNGRGMIKVCGGGDDEDKAAARKEMDELQSLDYLYVAPKTQKTKPPKSSIHLNSTGDESKAGQINSCNNSYSLPQRKFQANSMSGNRSKIEKSLEPYSKTLHPNTSSETVNTSSNGKSSDAPSDYPRESDRNPGPPIDSGTDAALSTDKPNLNPKTENESELSAAPAKTASLQPRHPSTVPSNVPASQNVANQGIKRYNHSLAKTMQADHRDQANLARPAPPTKPNATGPRDSAGRKQHPSPRPPPANIPSIQQPTQSFLSHPPPPQAPVTNPPSKPAPRPAPAPAETPGKCDICTTENDVDALTCTVCAHVLHPERDPRHWRCGSEACAGKGFVNSGDYGLCAVCGEKRGTRL